MADRALRAPSVSSLENPLKLYSLVAAVAGVGLLALAQPAEGKVVVTKKTIPIGPGAVSIDLNHDGLADFQFSITSGSVDGKRQNTLTAKGLTKGKTVGKKSAALGPLGPYASALVRGAKIGPSAHFSSAQGLITIERQLHAESAGTYYGNWYQVGNNRFLGVKFQIKGQTHYGWIRLTVDTGAFSATITGYAYETVANRVIDAGATSDADENSEVRIVGPSLGLLAQGAGAMPIWKRGKTE
jgi:hypothetical protein